LFSGGLAPPFFVFFGLDFRYQINRNQAKTVEMKKKSGFTGLEKWQKL
jgi:hypothetical protein